MILGILYTTFLNISYYLALQIHSIQTVVIMSFVIKLNVCTKRIDYICSDGVLHFVLLFFYM